MQLYHRPVITNLMHTCRPDELTCLLCVCASLWQGCALYLIMYVRRGHGEPSCRRDSKYSVDRAPFSLGVSGVQEDKAFVVEAQAAAKAQIDAENAEIEAQRSRALAALQSQQKTDEPAQADALPNTIPPLQVHRFKVLVLCLCMLSRQAFTVLYRGSNEVVRGVVLCRLWMILRWVCRLPCGVLDRLVLRSWWIECWIELLRWHAAFCKVSHFRGWTFCVGWVVLLLFCGPTHSTDPLRMLLSDIIEV